MDKSSPIEAVPLRSFRPDLVDDAHSQTENTSSTTTPPNLMVSPLRTIIPVTKFDDVNDEIHNTNALPPLMVTPIRTIRPLHDSNNNYSNAEVGSVPIKREQSEDVKDEIHNTTTPIRTIRPLHDSNKNSSNADGGHSTVPIKREPSEDVKDEIHNTTTPPPLMVTLLQTTRPSDIDSNNDSYDADAGPSTVLIKRGPSEDVKDETYDTTTPPPPMDTPLRTIKPFDDLDKDSYNADGGSSTIPIKGGLSKDVKDHETHNTTTPPPPMVTPLRTIKPFDDFNKKSYNADTGPRTVPMEGGLSKDETHNTTTSPPLMVTPLQTIRPISDSNNDSYDASAGPSTIPTKRGRGRPKGSKNNTKKPKTYDPNSKMVKSCPNFDSGITKAKKENGNQELVDSVLMRVDAVRRRLCQLDYKKGILTTASINCRNLGVMTNSKRRIGQVPGVQEGDIFYFWAEMRLIGLHIQMISGIDYMTAKDGAIDGPIATSVVTSGHYDDETEELDTLIYTGQGGTNIDGQARDQKLEKGNLALQVSKRRGSEVRVIRGQEDPNDKKKKIFVYDGLYYVSDYWKVKGRSGFEEFKFKMVRKPGQASSGYAMWRSAENLRKSGLSNSRKGFILQDLSSGTELLPVSLVNEVDEKDKTFPEDFVYTRSQYHSTTTLNLHVDRQSLGCGDCQGGSCLDASCICIQRNGGALPYHNRVLVCRKAMIYECGESCTCLYECRNRVVQTGLNIRLEVFKTTNCGWGLRSWEPIRAGTFICEFAGIIKTREQVEEDDDYVFDTSRIYNRFKWNYEPELLGEDVSEQVPEPFNPFNLPLQVLISGRKHGNVGRFMNHSCSPNILWQLIEYQMNGESCVRIGFFAMKHIPPMTELRYDYGVSFVEKIGEDETLIKGKKICLCGSLNCRGSFG